MSLENASETPQVKRLVEEFSRLPGIGPKTAQRLTYYLIRSSVEQSESLASAVLSIKKSIVLCTVCFHITEKDPCGICAEETRDSGRICVVEEPLDVIALERTGSFDGLYHVLHGSISPINGIGPGDLQINSLIERLTDGSVKEVILATNPNLEGEATSMYINNLISGMDILVTRPARGLPVGGDLEYADEATLGRALEGRQTF